MIESHSDRKNILRLAKKPKMDRMSSEMPSDSEWYQAVMPRCSGTSRMKEPIAIKTVSR